MEDRDELLAHYEAMRADLMAAIAGLDAQAMTAPVIDGWSVVDHLAHLIALQAQPAARRRAHTIVVLGEHDVGPGHAKTNLRDVSWKTLQPGDIVNIHYKTGGYHEKIQVCASGTAAQHIVIRGIPDPATTARA